MAARKPARKSIPEPYKTRLARLREAMAAKQLDGYLVHNRPEQIWLTGFTGEDGSVLVTPRALVLLTDGRFDETADVEAPFARKVLRKKRGAETTAREVKRLKIDKLGYEPDHLVVRMFTELKKELDKTRLVAASGLISKLRIIKDAEEVVRIRRAIDVAQRAFKKVTAWMKPGQTEREVAAKLIFEMQRLGAQGPSFPPIVASGPHGSLPHHDPTDRKLRDGEPVLIDWGARVEWYASDLTRMVWIGSIPRQIAKIYDIVREAQAAAIDAVRAGARTSEPDLAARKVISAAGYGKQFTHSVGHGLGLLVHDGPGLRRTGKDRLEAGMVVTIEPGIYLPGVGGVRLEDDVLVTENGHEVLSTLPL